YAGPHRFWPRRRDQARGGGAYLRRAMRFHGRALPRPSACAVVRTSRDPAGDGVAQEQPARAFKEGRRMNEAATLPSEARDSVARVNRERALEYVGGLRPEPLGHFIDGEPTSGAGGEPLDVIDQSTGET